MTTESLSVDLNRASLEKALSTLTHLVPSSPIIPILSNVLFETHDDVLCLTAGTDAVRMSLVLEVVDAPLNFCVEAAPLYRLVQHAKADRVTLEIEGETLILKAGRASARLPINSDELYPRMNDREQGKRVVLPDSETIERLGRALQQASRYPAKFDSGPGYNDFEGVWFSSEDEGLVLYSSDRRSLAFRSAPIPLDETTAVPFMVPTNTTSHLSSFLTVCQNANVTCTVEAGQTWIVAKGDDVGELRIRQLHVTMPNFRNLWTRAAVDDLAGKISLPVESIRQVAARVRAMPGIVDSSGNKYTVTLEGEGDTVTFFFMESDYSFKEDVAIGGKWEVPQYEVKFAITNLDRVAASASQGQLTIAYSTESPSAPFRLYDDAGNCYTMSLYAS